jgi:hypothetical protein
MAVDRFNNCENIVALAKKLGIRRLLYKWRLGFEVADAICEAFPPNAREGKLRKELGHVKRLRADVSRPESRSGDAHQRLAISGRGNRQFVNHEHVRPAEFFFRGVFSSALIALECIRY